MTMLTARNPYDRSDVIGEFPVSSPERIGAQLQRARHARHEWASIPATVRSERLHRAAAELDAERDLVAGIVVREVGKPIQEALAEVQRGIDILRYHAAGMLMPSGDVMPGSSVTGLQFTTRRPLGTVAIVTPWNFPVAIPLWKLVPALAYGNSVVLKPSSEAIGTATQIVEILARHLPEGLLTIATGDRAVVEHLLGSPLVDGVSFTGSTAVGRSIIRTAAERAIPCQTEMGGSNPSIVLRDADLDAAARSVATSAMAFAGQKCTATSRIIVESAVFAEFRDRLVAAVEGVEVGDPGKPSTATGPMINESALGGALEAVRHSSGRVLAGGSSDPGTNTLWPTLLEVDAGQRGDVLLSEEVFAPVAALVSAADARQAFAIASDTPYGLSAGLYTSDLRGVLDFITESEVGMVRVNAPTTGVDYWAPFGGLKASSYGSREQGTAAKDFFTHGVTVFIDR